MSDKGNRISQVVENRQHIIKHCRGKMFTSESLKIVALICIYSNVVSFEAIRNMCFSLLSILFVCLYNGQHGSKKKWIYYWAYPLHILFFAILRCYPFF